MSFIDWIWDLFRKPKKVNITDTKEISGLEVRKLLEKYTNNLWISDGIFRLINTEDLIKFLEINPVSKRKYITEAHDCDDFSYELMGDVSTWRPELSFGMVWGLNSDRYGHAWNFFIDQDGKVIFVEPQNDRIFEHTTEEIWIMII